MNKAKKNVHYERLPVFQLEYILYIHTRAVKYIWGCCRTSTGPAHLSIFSPCGQSLVSTGMMKSEQAKGRNSTARSAYGRFCIITLTPVNSANTCAAAPRCGSLSVLSKEADDASEFCRVPKSGRVLSVEALPPVEAYVYVGGYSHDIPRENKHIQPQPTCWNRCSTLPNSTGFPPDPRFRLQTHTLFPPSAFPPDPDTLCCVRLSLPPPFTPFAHTSICLRAHTTYLPIISGCSRRA